VRDTSHVLPPDPANFWEFTPGRPQLICAGPQIVTMELRNAWVSRALFSLTLNGVEVTVTLGLDQPWVGVDLANGEPGITFTLRKVEEPKAFLQVSRNPRLREVKRHLYPPDSAGAVQ
jgi:hypothetical protein